MSQGAGNGYLRLSEWGSAVFKKGQVGGIIFEGKGSRIFVLVDPAMQDDWYLESHSPDDIRVRGTRVGVEHVLEAYLAGSVPEEIALEFPAVTLEQVHGTIAWYLRNRTEVDAYLERWHSRAREARTEQPRAGQPDLIRRLRRLAQERVAG
jgi:uncharacterized protein (DUF433 family)